MAVNICSVAPTVAEVIETTIDPIDQNLPWFTMIEFISIEQN